MPLYEFLVVLAEPYAMAPSSAGPTRRVSSRQAPGPPATYTTRWDSPSLSRSRRKVAAAFLVSNPARCLRVVGEPSSSRSTGSYHWTRYRSPPLTLYGEMFPSPYCRRADLLMPLRHAW